MTRSFRAVLLAALVSVSGGALVGGLRPAEAASWRNLNGRMAPDLTFAETHGELAAGTRLSSFRNKQVVLLVFWLRDCPHCAREMPKVQRVHEAWGRSGLQVITVVHGFALDQVLPTMRKSGWTFPVVRDPKGGLAARYGGGRRPGSYVVGIDGRIQAGPSVAINLKPRLAAPVVERELARWRVKELGSVPTELAAARDEVYKGDYGRALKFAEPLAAAPDASPAVKAAVAKLIQITGRKLQNRAERAEDWLRAGNARAARLEYEGPTGILKTFQGTSLETRTRALYEAFRSRAGG